MTFVYIMTRKLAAGFFTQLDSTRNRSVKFIQTSSIVTTASIYSRTSTSFLSIDIWRERNPLFNRCRHYWAFFIGDPYSMRNFPRWSSLLGALRRLEFLALGGFGKPMTWPIRAHERAHNRFLSSSVEASSRWAVCRNCVRLAKLFRWLRMYSQNSVGICRNAYIRAYMQFE